MNLWLCEHVDLELLAQLRAYNSPDVLIHGSALTKFRTSYHGLPVSPMYWLDEAALRSYGAEKVAWNRRAREVITQAFAALCTGTNQFGVDSMFAGVIERLFYECSQGCLDALAFARSYSNARKGGDARVRVVVGGNYKLKELVALVWWLAVCNRLFGVTGVEYIWVNRNAGAVRVDSVDEVLNLLSSSSSAEPLVNGFVPEEMRAGKEPACLVWVGALRYPRGWDGEIHRRIGKPMRILRVAEQYHSANHESPCIELSAGNGGSRETMRGLFEYADGALALSWGELSGDGGAQFDPPCNAICDFFSRGVAPFVLEHISRTVNRLEQTLCPLDLQAFFSVTAPFIDSIALHEWARRRNILPVLLPHSWTSSHEFPAATYKSLLTFVRSEFIMPSVHNDLGSLAKEEVIPVEPVRSRNSLSSERQQGSKLKNIKLLLSLPFGQMWRTAWIYGAQTIVSRYLRWSFKRRMGKASFKVGYLLNYEHFEFTAGLDFNHLFRFVADIARKATDLPRVHGTALVLRRKAGWTNIHLLLRHIRAVKVDRLPNTVIFSPDGISLEQFGKLCDVVLYFQGTSAVPELMSLGVPMVQLIDSNAPVMLDEPYVVLPEEIVPRMTIEQVMNQLHKDPQWPTELSKLQRDWIYTQMAT